ERRNEQIVETVVVVVTHRYAKPEHWDDESSFASGVCERPVVVVVIELQDGLGTGVSRPVFAVDEQDVGPAVVVVINERAARAHGFRQIFLAEGAVVVGEMDSGLSGDVTELDLLCGRENRREKKKK